MAEPAARRRGQPATGLRAQPMPVATRRQPRDWVLLSTDGLKARDPQRQPIDLPRVLAALTGGLPDEAVDRVLANLHQAVGPELSDDLAFVLAEYRPIK